MLRFNLCILAAMFLFVVLPARAEDAAAFAPPAKESLLAAWEEIVRQNPETKIFEKTDEAGVYNFETTLFPYKGKLKVLNLLVEDRDLSSYGYEYNDYDDTEDTGYIGMVETELSDAPEDFFEKYVYSTMAWKSGNVLFYSNQAARWMGKAEWKQYLKTKIAASSAAAPQCARSERVDFISRYVGVIVLGIFLALVFLRLPRTLKKQNKLNETIMERQLEGLNIAKEGQVLQKEALDVLKSMLEAMKK